MINNILQKGIRYLSSLSWFLFFGFFLLLLTISPSKAFAFSGTHNWVCTDTNSGTPCSADVFSFDGSHQYLYNNSNSNLFQNDGQTIYITLQSSSLGTYSINESSGDGCTLHTGNLSDYAFTPTHSHTAISPVISTDSGECAGDTGDTGTISGLCMSDTSGGCAGGGGGGSTGSTTSPFIGFTASTTYQVIDNPNQDFMNGIWVFLAGMFGMIYFFKKR